MVLRHLNKALLPLVKEDGNFIAPALFGPDFVRHPKEIEWTIPPQRQQGWSSKLQRRQRPDRGIQLEDRPSITKTNIPIIAFPGIWR